MADFTERLSDLVFGSLPVVWKLVPEHLRKDVRARLRDLDPFARSPANEDLLRALRLAWVEATFAVDKRVVTLVSQPEWIDQQAVVDRFSALLRAELVSIRADAFRRDEVPTPLPIDSHLRCLLEGLPLYVRNREDDRGEELSRDFPSTLAATLGWPVEEVPALYAQVAQIDSGHATEVASRPFGELVFAAFAEIIKHPADNPEAAGAFQMAQTAIAREVALQTLSAARGLDSRFDSLLARLEGTPYVSIEQYARYAEDVIDGLTRLERKVDALPTAEQIASIVARTLAGMGSADLAQAAPGLGAWIADSPRDMVPASLLRAVTSVYGERDVSTSELVPTLERYAMAYRSLRDQMDSEESRHLYGSAAGKELTELIRRGDIAGADALMGREASRQQERAKQVSRDQSRILADRARIAYMRNDLAAMCLFLREAQHAVRSDMTLRWAYSLQTYTLLCREWRAMQELDLSGASDADQDLLMRWETLQEGEAITDEEWQERAQLVNEIDECAGLVIAKDPDFVAFRDWSCRMDRIAKRLFRMARRTGERFEARAALAGLELFGTSFYTSDDPIDIESNLNEQREARELYRKLSGLA